MTISEIPTTKIQQKPSISKFSRISVTIPQTKWYAHENQRSPWSIKTGSYTFLLKRTQQRKVLS